MSPQIEAVRLYCEATGASLADAECEDIRCLIFAAIGQGLVSQGQPVIAPPVYSAIVVMVMVTTLVTPPLLSWSLRRTPAES